MGQRADGNAQPRFGAPQVTTEALPDGSMIIRSAIPLGITPRCLGDLLRSWAARQPDRMFLAERDSTGGWRRMTYAAVEQKVCSIAQALLDRGLGLDRPVLILSENGIDHALMALGAMQVGVPVAPVSTAYSRRSQDFAKLRAVRDQIQPGLIFVDDGAAHAPALDAIGLDGAELVVAGAPHPRLGGTPFSTLAATEPRPQVDAAFAVVGPDTVAKILFTSGSTGDPKGVVNTQRMLCSNQEAWALGWAFLADRPPVLVDWLPWSHTFGGNATFNLALRNGGSYTIDPGKPAPGLIDKTVATLREVSPTVYFNVPGGYAMLLDYLERDAALAQSFFRDLDLMFYAAASLPQSVWDRLDAVAQQTLGRRVPMVSAWGTTETAPLATLVHFVMDRPGNIGVPASGTEIKLVPADDKIEIRVRGPNVTPGYWRRPDLTRALFDDDSFYRPGDAVRLANPDDPGAGIVFDGRLSENFKLTSGTWVGVGALRVAAIAACDPIVEDAVVTGHDRDEIGLLVFPSLAGCRALCPHLADAPLAALISEKAVRDALAAGLARHNQRADGSSRQIARAILLTAPPSIDGGEITDKGYLNQRAVLDNRRDIVERLHGDHPDIVLPSPETNR
jgi:feruloyl-CoA synthase